jgi:hypothetical protein
VRQEPVEGLELEPGRFPLDQDVLHRQADHPDAGMTGAEAYARYGE